MVLSQAERKELHKRKEKDRATHLERESYSRKADPSFFFLFRLCGKEETCGELVVNATIYKVFRESNKEKSEIKQNRDADAYSRRRNKKNTYSKATCRPQSKSRKTMTTTNTNLPRNASAIRRYIFLILGNVAQDTKSKLFNAQIRIKSRFITIWL